MAMTTTETQFVGIAAADDLDFLLSADDFEPETEIDTVALDATIDAITAARELLASLETLHGHLTAGGTADATIGHTIDVHTAAERLESALVDVTVDGTFDARGTVLL